jgi:hypothetical protein
MLPIREAPSAAASPQPDPKATGGTVPNMVTLDAVKTYLGITDDSQDALINGLIATVSYQFLNAINRLDFCFSADYTEQIRTCGKARVYLRHYPVNSVASVMLNGAALDPWDVDNPSAGGYRFDADDPNPENRQFIDLMGLYTDWQTYYYWPPPWAYSNFPDLVITYNGGYDFVPAAVQQAVIDWVAFRRNLSQLQGANPVLATEQIGDYSRGAGTGRVAVDYMGIYVPESVQLVIDQYQRIPNY